MGRLLALLLSDRHQVSLFETSSLSDKKSTGKLAAAMVAPTAESVIASAEITQMGYEALTLWPTLLARLNLSTPFNASGSLVLAHRQDVNDLSHFCQRVKTRNQTDLQAISIEQAQTLEPELPNHFAQALWLPNEGHIDNGLLFTELETKIKAGTIQLFEHTPVAIEQNQIVALGQPNNDHDLSKFDHIIDCRGLGAKTQLLQSDNRLRGVRGEVIKVHAPEVTLSRPIRLMHPRYPLYIVPKANQHFVIGATEIESQSDKGPSVRSVLELLTAAYSVHKGFGEAEIVSIDAGLRPTLSDNEPMVCTQDNVTQVNGLYRHGFLLTPSLVKKVIKHLNKCGILVDDLEQNQSAPQASIPVSE